MAPSTNPTRRPGLVPILLGLFICWQLVFIIGSSMVALPEGGVPGISHTFERWSWLTGQEQGWRQFTPGVPRRAAFVAFWQEGGPTVVSESDPRTDSFFRAFGANRLSSYELQFTMIALKEESITINEFGFASWREAPAESVRSNARAIRAYLGWRLRESRKRYPQLPPPDYVGMNLTFTAVLPPGTDWTLGPYRELPLARWKPGQTDLEAYNPATNSFVKVAEVAP